MNKNKERAGRIFEKVSPAVGASMFEAIAAATEDPSNPAFQVLLQRFTSTSYQYHFSDEEKAKRLKLNAEISKQE